MIYLIGTTGATETNDEKMARAMEQIAYYHRCSHDEYTQKLKEIAAWDRAAVQSESEPIYPFESETDQ